MKWHNSKWRLDRSKYLNRQEVALLFNRCRKLDSKAKAEGTQIWRKVWMLIDLSFHTGLRVSEIANLKIVDINLGISEPRLYVKNGKNSKSRFVPISGHELWSHLKEYINEFLPSVFQSNSKDDFLFQSSRQNRYSVSGLQHLCKLAMEQVGLDSHSIHHARHSFAFTYYGKTKDLRGLQQLLGHSDISTTEVYTIVPFEQLHKNCEALY